MRLRQTIEQELNRWEGTTDEPTPLGWDMPGGRLQADFSEVNPLACSFEQMAWRSESLEGLTAAQLRTVADQLSERLSYLLEELRPIEVDEQLGTVQLRSAPPAFDEGGGVSYYEMLATSGCLSLCRYQKQRGQPRQRVPTTVTREMLVRDG